jgi:CheY-like chemotaxis protein
VERIEQALEYLNGQGDFGDRGRFPFPRLILLDHKMPGDGWPIIEWVRARANLAALPVVVFSGSDDPNHQKKACGLGANAYHVKRQKFEDFIELSETPNVPARKAGKPGRVLESSQRIGEEPRARFRRGERRGRGGILNRTL